MPGFLLLIQLFFLSSSIGVTFSAQRLHESEENALVLSQKLLSDLKAKRDWQLSQKHLESLTYQQIKTDLKSNEEILAFWINTYNAYIQIQLKNNAKLYEDRGDFFSEKSIPFVDMALSFDEIEHGILRKSAWKYGLGYIKNPFVSNEIEDLEVMQTDPRIHFALNCGAKSCPKIAIYTAKNLDRVLAINAEAFLKENSVYKKAEKTVHTTPLFSWFKGDFGGDEEILKLLKSYGIIAATEDIEIKYTDYDWTMKLDNYAKP